MCGFCCSIVNRTRGTHFFLTTTGMKGEKTLRRQALGECVRELPLLKRVWYIYCMLRRLLCIETFCLKAELMYYSIASHIVLQYCIETSTKKQHQER